MRQKAHHRRHKQNWWKLIPVCVAQLECLLSLAITESGALPLCNNLSLTITGMSTTLSKTGRKDEPAQQGHRPRRSTATCGISTDFSTAATVGDDCLLYTCTSARPARRGRLPPCQRKATAEPQFSPLSDPGPVICTTRACRRPTKNCAVQHSVDERNLRYLPL